MPLSLRRKLQSQDLHPTNLTIQLTYRLIKYYVSILEDVPVQVGKFVIPCDFIVMDMDESSHVPIILGRPFLTIVGAAIDVPAGKISFQLCGQKVNSYFPPPIALSVPAPPVPAVPTISHMIKVFDEM